MYVYLYLLEQQRVYLCAGLAMISKSYEITKPNKFNFFLTSYWCLKISENFETSKQMIYWSFLPSTFLFSNLFCKLWKQKHVNKLSINVYYFLRKHVVFSVFYLFYQYVFQFILYSPIYFYSLIQWHKLQPKWFRNLHH